MKREDFDKLLKELRNEINDYSNGYGIIEDSDYIYNNKIKTEEVYSEVLDQNRWSVVKEVVFKIADKYYISVVWNDPATEMQDGQNTDCEIYEVEPFEETVVKYRVIE